MNNAGIMLVIEHLKGFTHAKKIILFIYIESIHNTDYNYNYNSKISPSNNAYSKSYCHLEFQV